MVRGSSLSLEVPAATQFGRIEQCFVSRRAALIGPVIFAAWFALLRRPQRRVPDPAKDGTGPLVALALFDARGERISTVWLRQLLKSEAEWRGELSVDQFGVTRRGLTDMPFTGSYRNSKAAGMYRCTCCGTALFQSKAKFDSGTGWPSFSAPAAAENLYTAVDTTLAERRVEILCRKCGAHLGHVFPDGPRPTGLRYCVNSSALVFEAFRPN